MRFALADPPYPDQSRRWYKDHPDYGGGVDSCALAERLAVEYPDGWALCTNATSLRAILPHCPVSTRICAWVKPFTPFRRGVRLAYAWEPVLIVGGRSKVARWGTTFDWYAESVNVFNRGSKLAGQKPEGWCFWLFDCLGAEIGDTLTDIYPGGGGVGRAWEKYQAQTRLDAVGERPKQTRLAVPE